MNAGLIWSVALAAVGILGIYLAGRKNLWGWAIGCGAQALWIVYALVTSQYGFVLSAGAYALVYGRNWLRWQREKHCVVEEFIETDEFYGDEDPQTVTDRATIRAHLTRGTQPRSGRRMWGGLEWAIHRLTGIEPEPARPSVRPEGEAR